MMHYFEGTARDLLFMRDARPMESQDVGMGAAWPRGDQLASALHQAFLQKWPQIQPWESIDGASHTFRDKRDARFSSFSKDKNENSSCRFGGMKVVGPFPKKDDEIYLPCPLDLNMRLIPCEGTNLPEGLTHAFLPATQEKVRLPEWISARDYAKYLNGWFFKPDECELYACERAIGVALDAERHTARDGKLYQAEYLRLREGVSLAFGAECPVKQRVPPQLKNDARVVEGETDALDTGHAPEEIVLGGQQGLVALCESADALKELEKLSQTTVTTRYVKWTLLSPCIFKRGWLPGWVSNDRVMLPRETIVRKEGEKRADFKKRQSENVGINAKLIAARIGKPITFSGWNLIEGGPKANHTAVPAGSSYVFECESIEEAQVLARHLSYPNRRSDEQGEKGFGIGICSSVTI